MADSCFKVDKPCKLCALLGRDNARTHEWSACYANPRSSHYRIKSYRARMADLVWKGIEIPGYM